MYNDEIMDRYQNPIYFGKPKKFDIKIEKPSRSCGDKVILFITLKEDIIEDIQWEGDGCIISMVSTDLFCEMAKGKKLEDVRKMDDFSYIEKFPIEVTSGRYNCVLLPLKGLKEEIKEK